MPVRKSSRNKYPVNQCALFKINSKRKLAEKLFFGLTDLKNLAKRPSNENYIVFLLKEKICEFTGDVTKERWVQTPKPGLRAIHERIQQLLRRVEAPEYFHGAIKGRSYRTNADVHKNSNEVAVFDVRKFYPSTSESRVFDFFRENLNCSSDVSTLLMQLCCYNGGLPTGSPLSPVLSLFANAPMFAAVNSLAEKYGLKLTIYIDDITLSGAYVPKNIGATIAKIAREHGHMLSLNKTKFFDVNTPKHVTGTVISSGRVTVPHKRFRKARAISEALSLPENSYRRVKLARKLSGLLGEAAYLDARYKRQAEQSYEVLKSLCRKQEVAEERKRIRERVARLHPSDDTGAPPW
jgi:hypothetical protein